jgi:mono/diheme cytochrome c family protein
LVGLFLGLAPSLATAQDTEASIERGRYIVTITGCNDCHTEGYAEAKGDIPESEWLKGSAVGFRGPWGTSYAFNLRIYIPAMNEDEWVAYARNVIQDAWPPMPGYAVQKMDEADLRSLHKFIVSLGEAGDPAPYRTPPGMDPGAGPHVIFPGAR